MVGIARVVMARRERVIMLEPFGKGIMGMTLHYPYEIRSEEAVFEEIPELKLPDQMIGLAEDIIDKMSCEFEPDKFEDRYENAMIELIRAKQASLPAPKEKPAARPANVVNLMDALGRQPSSPSMSYYWTRRRKRPPVRSPVEDVRINCADGGRGRAAGPTSGGVNCLVNSVP
jgi:DNA end-binding protein Ku